MARSKHNYQRSYGRGLYFVAAAYQSEAFLALTLRARCVLIAALSVFNGCNNGKIGLSIDRLGTLMGINNPSANSKALYELVAYGFLRVAKEYSKPNRLAREWRITFIETGPKERRFPATNEFLHYQSTPEYARWIEAGNGKKRRPPNIETETVVSLSKFEHRRKLGGSKTAMEMTETSNVSKPSTVSMLQGHIYYQGKGKNRDPRSQPSSFMARSELRDFVKAYLSLSPLGTQSKLAKEIGLPGGTLSKFLTSGKLPANWIGPLQSAVARRYGVDEWRANHVA